MFTTAGRALSTTGAKLVSILPGVTDAAAAAATGATAGGRSAHECDAIAAPAPAASRQYTRILVSLRKVSRFIFRMVLLAPKK
jgi:hypothetical protein